MVDLSGLGLSRLWGKQNMINKLFGTLRLHFRRRRYAKIRDLLDVESMHGFVLDLGGGPASFFAAMFPRSEQVILLDIDYRVVRQAKRKLPALHAIVADAERLPLADQSIDATICNSVLEHVDDPLSVASEIRRVSQGYFVQVPNGRFPLETHPHIGIPFYPLVPWVWLRRLLCKVFGGSYEFISGVNYLQEQELQALFPSDGMSYERFFLLKKSFYIHRPASLHPAGRTDPSSGAPPAVHDT
jgi:SAM-dependent methyltransferase